MGLGEFACERGFECIKIRHELQAWFASRIGGCCRFENGLGLKLLEDIEVTLKARNLLGLQERSIGLQIHSLAVELDF